MTATQNKIQLHKPCPAALALLEGLTYSISGATHDELKKQLHPDLHDTRRDRATAKRLEYIVTQVIRHYLPEAFKNAGANAAAAAIIHEPCLRRAGNLTSQFASNLYDQANALPKGNRRTTLAETAHCATCAADAVKALHSNDPEEQLKAAEHAARALYHNRHRSNKVPFRTAFSQLFKETLEVR